MRIYSGALILVGLLAGCGGGGNAPSTNQTNGTVEKGAVEISLAEAPVAKSTEKTVSLPAPTNIRVYVYNGTYSTYKDLTLPTASTTVSVPAGTGYNVYVASYIAGQSARYGLKNGGQGNVNISAGANTPVAITLQPPVMPTLTLPGTVTSQSAYTVQLSTFSDSIAFMQSFQCLSPFVNDDNNPTGTTIGTMNLDGSSNMTAAAPQTLASGNLYQKFIFYDKVEKQVTGTYGIQYIYPDPAHGDSAISVPIQPPSGGMSVGITY